MIELTKLAKRISLTTGTQEELDKLAKREDFTTILDEKVEAGGLTVQGVMASFHHLDSLVSKPLIYKPRSPVTVLYTNLTNEERAALVILFRVQYGFPKSVLVQQGEIQ